MIRGILLSFSVIVCFSACAPQFTVENPDTCPVTAPSQGTSSLPATIVYEGRFWFGTSALWTNLPTDGIWRGLPQEGDGYVQKTVFWREGYVAIDEPNPELIVSGRQLDAPSKTFSFSDATHGWDETGDFMLMGISIPTEGCWEITAEYQEVQLTYVVEIVP
jgi:hypothetical protein